MFLGNQNHDMFLNYFLEYQKFVRTRGHSLQCFDKTVVLKVIYSISCCIWRLRNCGVESLVTIKNLRTFVEINIHSPQPSCWCMFSLENCRGSFSGDVPHPVDCCTTTSVCSPPPPLPHLSTTPNWIHPCKDEEIALYL
jgi:hypothetical protein